MTNRGQRKIQAAFEKALIDVGNAYNEVCPLQRIGTIGLLTADLRADNADDKTILTQAVGRLYDGLAYGNW